MFLEAAIGGSFLEHLQVGARYRIIAIAVPPPVTGGNAAVTGIEHHAEDGKLPKRQPLRA
jgi:hypothetical protein